jgi:hypothetical protein
MRQQDSDFALVCLLKEAGIVISTAAERKTKVCRLYQTARICLIQLEIQIEILHAGIDFSICADTVESFQDIMRDISIGWAQTRSQEGVSTDAAGENVDVNEDSSDPQTLLGKQNCTARRIANVHAYVAWAPCNRKPI